MRLTKTLERLAAHGATIEQLIEVVRVHEEELEEELTNKREKERLRKRKQRMMSHDVPGTDRDNTGHPGTDGDLSSPSMVSPRVYNNNTIPPSLTTPSLNTSFGEFWLAYPRKVGKGSASKAYARAVKKAPPETILAAVKSYPWPTDKDFIPHPATWLNGERWADETTAHAKPSVETFRVGHARGLVKFEPEAPKLTEEEMAERARRVDAILKGSRKPVEGLGGTGS